MMSRVAQVHQREPPNFAEATRCYREAEKLMLDHKVGAGSAAD